MDHPIVPPVVEIVGMAVSRHAGFGFGHFRSSLDAHMAYPANTPASTCYLTYGKYDNMRSFRPAGGTLLCHTPMLRCSEMKMEMEMVEMEMVWANYFQLEMEMVCIFFKFLFRQL